MKVNNLKTEEELQSWFIHQMEQYFNENGKRLIGWDEILQGGVSPTATVMWWQSYEKEVVKKSIARGNSVILCPNYDFYLDYSEIGQSTRLICESKGIVGKSRHTRSCKTLRHSLYPDKQEKKYSSVLLFVENKIHSHKG